jgi:aryl-alcohol dehydrogenase-like predicted oxidoreductase
MDLRALGRMWPVLEQQTMDDVVVAALEGGISWFDTAQVYGDRVSAAIAPK